MTCELIVCASGVLAFQAFCYHVVKVPANTKC